MLFKQSSETAMFQSFTFFDGRDVGGSIAVTITQLKAKLRSASVIGDDGDAMKLTQG